MEMNMIFLQYLPSIARVEDSMAAPRKIISSISLKNNPRFLENNRVGENAICTIGLDLLTRGLDLLTKPA
jgi:hypothetical protein